MSDMWLVKQNTGQRAGRRLFEGLEEDARLFIENNFPRPHIEPGGGGDELQADVHLISPEGVREHFLGKDYFFVDETPETEEENA